MERFHELKNNKFEMYSNLKPLFMSHELQLPLGLSIMFYLCLWPWKLHFTVFKIDFSSIICLFQDWFPGWKIRKNNWELEICRKNLEKRWFFINLFISLFYFFIFFQIGFPVGRETMVLSPARWPQVRTAWPCGNPFPALGLTRWPWPR